MGAVLDNSKGSVFVNFEGFNIFQVLQTLLFLDLGKFQVEGLEGLDDILLGDLTMGLFPVKDTEDLLVERLGLWVHE